MADYTESATLDQSTYPENAIDAQEWSRVEPLINAEQLKRRFLWGIPLVSPIRDPITGKADVMTNEDLKEFVLRAVAQVELDTGIDIFPVQRSEGQDFDRNLLVQYGHLRLDHRPILSVDKLSVRPAGNQDIYIVPPEWIDHKYFTKGLLHIIPLMPAVNSGIIPTGRGGGTMFLQIIAGGRQWIPAYWNIEYTTGFKDGILPKVLNELIGCYAGVDVLAILQATYRSTSYSLGVDGISQSGSTPGPNMFDPRIKQLELKKKQLLGKFKALFQNKFILSNI
jgi:hypothetical protein